MVYTHLTVFERYQIFSLTEAGHKPAFVARQLSRDPSTIYRELKRNLVFDPRVTGYSPVALVAPTYWPIFNPPPEKSTLPAPGQ